MTATSAATAASGVVSAASDARGITIIRVFDAPRELVFDAWTKPEHFVTWFGEHGSEIPLSGEFGEVEPPNKVSLTLVDPGDPTGPNVELLTAVLRDLGDGRTEMT